MKLFMTLLVRDNEDIVEANIRYHLARGVDHVIVTDNGSVDDTRRIVSAFERAGHVTLIDEPRDDYDQPAWVTRMARKAAAMGADWAINNDVDEMWLPLGTELKPFFERVPREYGSVIAPRTNVLPLRELDGHPFERLVYREVHSVNGLGRPLPGKAAHRAVPDVSVLPGNHTITAPSLGPAMATDDLLIFHYPYRSYAQFERKIALGGAALARNTAAPKTTYDVWRSQYELLRGGGLRGWYDGLSHADDSSLATRLARGEVVKDERLAEYLRRHAPSVNR